MSRNMATQRANSGTQRRKNHTLISLFKRQFSEKFNPHHFHSDRLASPAHRLWSRPGVVVVSPGIIASIRVDAGSGTAFKIVADATNFGGRSFVRLHEE
jgi:hypothetical protein